MKAIVYHKYGSPKVLELTDVAKPVPGDDEVLIKVHAAAVSATDTTFRKGKPLITRAFLGFTKPKKYIPGDALAGEVVQSGKNVKLFQTGSQIYGATGDNFGAHAEYKSLPETGALATKPVNMNWGEAAAVCDGALVALPFLRDNAKIQKGQKILIIGASGAIGTFAVQLAKYYGAIVTGLCSTANVELVKSLGADKVIDYRKEDFTQSVETWDVIFDTVGKSSFPQCKKALSEKGIYLSTVLNFSILFHMIRTKSADKRAEIAFTGMRNSAERAKDLVFLKELIEAGKIRSVIDRQYPFEEIAKAHSYVETGHKKGNVVLNLEHLNNNL